MMCDDICPLASLALSNDSKFQSIGVQVQLRQAINFRLWATLCLCAHWRAQLLACVVEHAPWELGRLVAQRVPSWCLMVLITEFHASSHFVSDRVCPLVSHTNSKEADQKKLIDWGSTIRTVHVEINTLPATRMRASFVTFLYTLIAQKVHWQPAAALMAPSKHKREAVRIVLPTSMIFYHRARRLIEQMRLISTFLKIGPAAKIRTRLMKCIYNLPLSDFYEVTTSIQGSPLRVTPLGIWEKCHFKWLRNISKVYLVTK